MYRKLLPPFLIAYLDRELCADLTDVILLYCVRTLPKELGALRVKWKDTDDDEFTITNKYLGDFRLQSFYCLACSFPSMRFIDKISDGRGITVIISGIYVYHCEMKSRTSYSKSFEVEEFSKLVDRFWRGEL